MTATLPDPATRPSRPSRPKRTARPSRTARPAPTTVPVTTASLVASSAATMVVLVSLWMLAQLLVLGGLGQQRAQDVLYDEFRVRLAATTAPLGPVVDVGEPVALLSIPRLGVDQVVVEGTASGDTLAGPGHRRDTVLPGQVGTSVVYGRARTYGAPFAPLLQLRVGDVVIVTTAQGRTVFTTTGIRRAGDPLPQPVADGAARLTLVTAEGGGRLPALTPGSTLYVDADVDEGLPAPPGRLASVPGSEQAMASDPSALPLLTVCLALLLATTLGVVAARQRWSTVLVWVVAAPVASCLAWIGTDVVMRLLPNLL